MKIRKEDLIRKDEKILWEGKPETFSLFSKAAGRELILKWVAIPLLCIFVCWLKVTHSDVPEYGFIALLALIAVIIMATLLIKKPQAMKQRYLMTNERIILIKPSSAYYMELKDIDGYRVVTGQTDQPSVVFGKEIFPDINGYLLWRVCAEVPTKDRYESVLECTAMVFFNVAQTAKLVSYLTEAGVKQA